MDFRIIFLLILSAVICYGDLPCNKIAVEHGYICSCNATYCDTISPPKILPAGGFHLYYTSHDSPGFNQKTGNFSMESFSPFAFKYEVNKRQKFQQIRGFGGSFTDSFGAAINKLSNETQENVLKSFFSEDGLEYSVCRVVIGSSDFSIRNYTYVPDYDPTLKSFSLTEDDYIYKIKHIKRAMDLSRKKINFFGSAWNSPEWMKIGNSTQTDFLKPEFRQVWADYHIKFLDSFRSEGIDFWALTTGNEPITLFMIPAMDILTMFPEEQREWIVNNLGPALEKANYSTKVIVLDDMRMYATWWMNSIMRDKRSEKYVLGIGLHFYTDIMSSLETLDIIHEKYPNQEIIYTESSINVIMNFLDENDTYPYQRNEPFKNQSSGPDLGSWPKGAFYAMNIIENLNHWTTTYVDWNLGLDEKGGPNMNGFPCDASVIVNITNNEFYKQPLFYVMGHFSKFILPDSFVIGVKFINTTQYYSYGNLNEPEGSSTQPPPHPFPTIPPFSKDVQYIGVLNPDTSVSIIFYNPKPSFAEVEVYDPDRGYATLNLEPKSLSTLLYW